MVVKYMVVLRSCMVLSIPFDSKDLCSFCQSNLLMFLSLFRMDSKNDPGDVMRSC